MTRVLWWLLLGMVALAAANVGPGAGGVRPYHCPPLAHDCTRSAP